MQYLEQVSRSPRASWYRLLGAHQGEVQRWVVSTPQGVSICNHPELLGVEYSTRLRQGMASALVTAPFGELLTSVPSGRLCIMNFLRGSLNFDLRGALWDALGSNIHATCFMSSQRFREEGRWHVKEDMYRKIRIPDGAIMLVADVVATGVTVSNGLDVILDHVEEQGVRIGGVVFFTIGCHKVEKVLERVHRRLAARDPDYAGTHAVYLEGKLTLVDSQSPLIIGIPGTDLVKRGALLAPEFELSQYPDPAPPLERCAIYDAGSRAFDVAEYLDDVEQYWEQVRRLARRRHSLRDVLLNRWPETGYDSIEALREAKSQVWRGVDPAVIDALWEAHELRWTESFDHWSRSPEALADIATRRLATFARIRDQGWG